MQCPVTNRMLLVSIRSYLKSVIRQSFNFGYLSSGHPIFMSARMWGSFVVFRNQKGSASQNVWATLLYSINRHVLTMVTGCVLCEVRTGFVCVFLKGKAVPLQAWSGPEDSRKLRFPDFMTTAQDGGKLVSLTHRPPLPPGNTPGTHFC
jgi:hypothetical protein